MIKNVMLNTMRLQMHRVSNLFGNNKAELTNFKPMNNDRNFTAKILIMNFLKKHKITEL